MATQSLYRRYRPRRFSEIKGQDHVVRALRDAVASGREGQAYLFSGPRGTGKTTSARVLAKVLNCDNVADGEPCCECDSCLAVERGTSYDVHELDAASNNGVDAIRDLVEKASLGTPGRHKVYILDEVHMLSKAAEAALLKTLEEPPPHVVFVLATTDPQKMSDTIRSRTQHLQFHLLPTDTLADHVRWVAGDAGLELSQSALDAALVQGGGSARDTLSALELLASTGGDVSDVIDLDEFLIALVEHDPGRVLTAMGHAVSMGRDPRTVTEDLVRHLRNAFLSLMAPELVVLPAERLDALATQAQQLGAAALVRAIERLGASLTDMRHAPDPRILVEVALVQLTHDEASTDADAMLARLERLEQAVKQLRQSGPVAGSSDASPKDPSTGRAVLGGASRRPTPAPKQIAPDTVLPDAPALPDQPAAAAPVAPAAPADDRSPAPSPDTSPATSPATQPEAGRDVPGAASTVPPIETSDDAPAAVPAAGPATASMQGMSVTDAWEHSVKGQVKPLVRALYSAGSFIGNTGDTWQFSVPNEAHGSKCADHRAAVEAALSAAVGSAITIEFVVGGRSRDDTGQVAVVPTPAASPEPAIAGQPTDAPVADDDIDMSELTDAPPESVKTPVDRLAEAFPGSELVNDD